MIKMANIELIRKLHYVEKRSIRQLSKDLGYSRQTIRKALEQNEIPRYTRTAPIKRPAIDAVKPLILQWMQEDQTAPLKQRHSAAQIYRRLVNDYQFTGGESTVRHFVRQVKQEWDLLSPPSSIPLEFQAGEFAQFDWGEVIIELNGIEIKCMLFCMRLLYSRKIFVKVFPHQRQEALFQGHLDAFNYFGGVPKTIVYDNMKTAVKKVLEGTKREEQEAFIAFRSAFLFDAQFCAPAKGNEKGQVEKLVQTARAQFLVPVPKVTSFEELNDYLKMCCDRYDLHKVPNSTELVHQRFTEEKVLLLPILSRFDCARRIQVNINTLALVNFETNRYSVPTRYSGRKDAFLYAYVDKIIVQIDGETIAEHERLYTQHGELLDIDHYLDELERKPRAIPFARPLKKNTLPPSYQSFYRETNLRYGHGKELIRVLKLHRDYPASAVENAVRQSVEKQLFTCDAVKQFLYQTLHPAIANPLPMMYEVTESIRVKPPALGDYNELLKGGIYH